MLSFQRLDVYQLSIQFMALTAGAGGILDPTEEGAGRSGKAAAARHFSIARGSAMECAAALDVCRLLNAMDEPQHARGCELLARVVAMLTKMSQ